MTGSRLINFLMCDDWVPSIRYAISRSANQIPTPPPKKFSIFSGHQLTKRDLSNDSQRKTCGIEIHTYLNHCDARVVIWYMDVASFFSLLGSWKGCAAMLPVAL